MSNPAVNPNAPHRAAFEAITNDDLAARGDEAAVFYERHRRAMFREHADALLANDPRFAQWQKRMAATYGPLAKVWRNALPWGAAYLVGRYGEDVGNWPFLLEQADYEKQASIYVEPTTVPGIKVLGNRTRPLDGEQLFGFDDASTSEG